MKTIALLFFISRIRGKYSQDYKDRQILETRRMYVNVIGQRPYIRHIPGCRSFFRSKGKAALLRISDGLKSVFICLTQ